MKILFLIISIFTFLIGNSQIAPNIWENLPDYIKGNLPLYFSEDYISVPDNAYYLQPDVTGNFTKSMVETAISNGENYIVFDTDTLNIDYADVPTIIDGQNIYLDLELEGTEAAPITLDFRNVYINCFPDTGNLTKNYNVLAFRNSNHVVVKFGTVEGDKFKRALATNAETSFESSYLVLLSFGAKNITIDGGATAGFMGDVITGSPFGSQAIDTSPLDNNYYAVGSNRYESGFYTVNPALYSTFGLVGGLGYNRLLYYDMEDIIFKFFNSSNTEIASITSAKYFETYEFPNVAGITKMKVNVRAMDGRTESPTNFGHNLQYNPNSGATVKNIKIFDNHRGGISNIGAYAVIDNCEFYNNPRYFTVPEFGIDGNTNSTTYHINCEDVVSRNLTITNSDFKDKFHKILLTHNISATINNNTFSGDGSNIFIYDLLSGTISGNDFNTGEVSGGNGTNKSTVSIQTNTGAPDVTLSNGAEWKLNIFTGGKLTGKGKANNNTFTNVGYAYLKWTKEVHSNTFLGNNGSVQYVEPNSYNYQNNFTNTGLRFQDGTISDTAILDGVLVDYSATPINDALYRSTNPITVIAINSTFKDAKIFHRTINQATNYAEGSWYFENCTFQDITSYVINLAINVANTVPAKFYFKNCTFTGSGTFITKTYGTGLYEIVFDNCTIAPTITMPASYTNATVTMPTIIEPRTQPIPQITRNGSRTEIATDFHIMTLKIRNKNTLAVVLDEDVCSTYLHYNADPTNFEYSIDGGRYWDSINN